MTKRRFIYTIYAIIFGLTFQRCVEPFEPEVGEYDSTLVVDGLFSNSEAPSTVILSRSFALDEEFGASISNAVVIIEDDNGGQFTLQESEPGKYQTDPSVFRGTIGSSYRLRVTTSEGNQFESDWELMKEAPPIENLYFEHEEHIPIDPSLNPVLGVQFYLDTNDPEGNTRFYRWEFEETFEYGLRFPARVRADFGAGLGGGDDQIIPIEPGEFEGLKCWKTVNSKRVLIGTTEDLVDDVIKKQALHFVDNSSSRLYLRYSILVRQYAISKAHYDNLRKIEEINQSSGSLFDPIPNEVLSNVRSLEDQDIPVLGYFAVAGESQARIFLDRDDIPEGFGAPFGPVCMTDTLPLNFQRLYQRTESEQFILYDYDRNFFGVITGYLITEQPCARCAVNGAQNEAPDFWE